MTDIIEPNSETMTTDSTKDDQLSQDDESNTVSVNQEKKTTGCLWPLMIALLLLLCLIIPPRGGVESPSFPVCEGLPSDFTHITTENLDSICLISEYTLTQDGQFVWIGGGDTALVTSDSTGTLINAFTGQIYFQIEYFHPLETSNGVTSPSVDGTLFARGLNRIAIDLYNLVNGELITTLSSYSENSRIWDIDVYNYMKSYGKKVTSLAFSPDNKYLAAGLSNGEIYIWDTKRFILEAKVIASENPVRELIFSADGKLIASNSGEEKPDVNEINIWDISSIGKEKAPRINNIKKLQLISVAKIFFAPEDTALIVIEGRSYQDSSYSYEPSERSIHIYDIQEFKEQVTLNFPAVYSNDIDSCNGVPQIIGFSPDYKLMVTGSIIGWCFFQMPDGELLKVAGLNSYERKNTILKTISKLSFVLGAYINRDPKILPIGISPDGKFLLEKSDFHYYIYGVQK